MKVILLKSVPKLGKTDDVVDVGDGYARNALFPNKLAVPATASALEALRSRQHNKATQKEIQHNLLDRAIASLEGKALVYKAKANDKGNLFSKIDVEDISDELLKQYRIAIDAKHMSIDMPIKHTGTYTVTVADGSYKTSFALEVVAQ